MLNNEPNWTYRDLLSCTLAEVDAQMRRAADAHQREDALAKACGAIGLWLRLTDESRNPEDIGLLMGRINAALPLPRMDSYCALGSSKLPMVAWSASDQQYVISKAPRGTEHD
ncbi:hypothetical protein [Massilia haematophila]|uniref:Uncharacterized protein n=1 Tax=Massilia haematophila TaxID=457923 RepID=A0ABV7PLP0_9BURK